MNQEGTETPPPPGSSGDGAKHSPRMDKVSATSWALIAELIVTVGGLLTFMQLGVLLSLSDFGVLSAIQSLARPAVALAIFGAPSVLIRRVAQGKAKQDSWERAITMWYGGSLATAAALILLKPIILHPAPMVAYVLLVLTYTIFSTHGELLFTMATATGDMKLAALARLFAVGPRLAALALYYILDQKDLETWAVLALVAHVFGTAVSWFYGHAKLQLRTRSQSPSILKHEARTGIGFAMSGMSAGILDASDRPILVNNGFGEDSGAYAIGARVVSFSLAPTLALMRATTEEIFACGANGLRETVRATMRWVPVTLTLNITIGLVLYVSAPAVLWFLPDTHVLVPQVIRVLAWFPLIRSVQYLAGNALDAAGFQLQRFVFTIAAAVLNLGLNLWLIPIYGWEAAVGTTIASEVFLLLALSGFALVGAKQDLEPRPA